MNVRKKSQYTASITGGGLLFEETNILIPLLQAEDRVERLKEEALNNHLLKINAETSRKRSIDEVARRYDTMPITFWKDYQQMVESDQLVACFFVILKTYKLLFDFHINLTIRKWNSISKSISFDDVMMEFNEIAANDEFVDSWADSTKRKVTSAYLTILRKVGMLSQENQLQPLQSGNFAYYLSIGEGWFLEACLLQAYQIEAIKKNAYDN